MNWPYHCTFRHWAFTLTVILLLVLPRYSQRTGTPMRCPLRHQRLGGRRLERALGSSLGLPGICLISSGIQAHA